MNEPKEIKSERMQKTMDKLWKEAKEAGFNLLAPYIEWKESQNDI